MKPNQFALTLSALAFAACTAAIAAFRSRIDAGKISTAIQILAIVLILGANAHYFSPMLIPIAIGAVAAGTLFSGLDYVRLGWNMMKE